MITTLADCASYVTVYPIGHSGLPKVSRETKARKVRTEPTVPELRAMCIAAGLKASTKHIKHELILMLQTKVWFQAAAQTRENVKRKAARAARA